MSTIDSNIGIHTAVPQGELITDNRCSGYNICLTDFSSPRWIFPKGILNEKGVLQLAVGPSGPAELTLGVRGLADTVSP